MSANRTDLRYRLTVDPEYFLRNQATIIPWALSEGMELTFNYSSGKWDGKIMFSQPGQSKKMMDFITTLRGYYG